MDATCSCDSAAVVRACLSAPRWSGPSAGSPPALRLVARPGPAVGNGLRVIVRAINRR